MAWNEAFARAPVRASRLGRLVSDKTIVREGDIAPIAIVVVALALVRVKSRVRIRRGLGIWNGPGVQAGAKLPAKVESNRIASTAGFSQCWHQSGRQSKHRCKAVADSPHLAVLRRSKEGQTTR